jgi:DNA-binding MarR family transcriptional regulator
MSAPEDPVQSAEPAPSVEPTELTEPAGPVPDRDEMAARLARVIGRVGRRTRPTHGGLSAGHYSTLSSVQQLGPQRLGDLARTERVSAPTMTRIVQALEERGLAIRTATPDDARSTTVSSTPEGDRLLRVARVERAAAVRELLDALAPDELAVLAQALGALESIAHEALVGPARDTPARDPQSSTTR